MDLCRPWIASLRSQWRPAFRRGHGRM